jgi:hypothetical protein
MDSMFSRSVHNTCIEHLWYDVMHGFSQKWKNFFHNLKINHGLNPRSSADIWLLHHLFLASVHQDALEWAEAWDLHKLQIKGMLNRQAQRSGVNSKNSVRLHKMKLLAWSQQ